LERTYRPVQARAGYAWRPALHYGLAYTVFALSIRHSSVDAAREPAVFIAFFALGAFPVLVWSLWNARRRRSHRNGPRVRWTAQNVVSGLSTVLIVATTVMAFMFEAVSIVLALVMMRMGVLMIAPLIDWWGQRTLSSHALLAGGLCLAGCAAGAIAGTFSPLSGAVVLVLIGYLLGYAIRLALMSRYTKSRDRALRGDWFVVEMAIVTIALAAVGLGALPSLVVLSGARGELVSVLASFTAGAAYSYALINGTLIYLDWRANVRSVTINRATSLASGVVASLLGAAFLSLDVPGAGEWMLAIFMISALTVLAREPASELAIVERERNL